MLMDMAGMTASRLQAFRGQLEEFHLKKSGITSYCYPVSHNVVGGTLYLAICE